MTTEEYRRLVIRTQRLALRATTLDDAPAIHANQNHPAVARYLRPNSTQTEPYTIEDVRKSLKERIAGHPLHMVVYLLPAEKHIPTPTGLSPYDANLKFPDMTLDDVSGDLIGAVGMKNTFDIGYAIRYEDWGKGIAPEAVAGMLREIWSGRYGTLLKGVPEGGEVERVYVTAGINPENRGSARVLEKLGAVMAGEQEVEDWDQTPEERERDGARMFKLQSFRLYKPESLAVP